MPRYDPGWFPYDDTGVTTELRAVVQSGVDPWAFDYPSYYKGDAKAEFEKLVLAHFWFRQIGSETVGRWLHQFRTKVREIMPYYIQLYESVDLMKAQQDPFQAYDLTETFTRQTDGQTTTENTATGKTTDTGTGSAASEKRFSNTPQGSISNIDSYLTEATVEEQNTTNDNTQNVQNSASGTSETQGSESYTLTRKGNIGVQPLGKEVQALRESYLNIDMMIIGELNSLFLGVY